jgi:nucleoside-diphosphate-sugar epimerase
MRALITGGSGYLGSRLTKRLVDEGHSVHLLLRSSASLNLLGETAHQIVTHEDAGTWEGVSTALERSKPDVVFHLASLFLPSHRPQDIERLVQSNILFGAELLEAMSLQGVSRLVVAGTAWQHYEDSDYDPTNLYAATKQAFETLLSYWLAVTPLRAIVLKLYDTYGPGDPRPKLVPLLMRLAETGEGVAFSPGEQIIEMVHVNDAIEAFVLAGIRTGSLSTGSKETYAVNSDNPVSLRDLVTVFEGAVGRSLAIAWGEREYRTREVMRPWSKGARVPGWRPRIELAEGFRQLIADRVQTS